MDLDDVFEKSFAALPLATYRAGESILTEGSKSDRLLILKKGAVAIIKDSIEIARVGESGAVLGEISALLDQPHTADVRALEDSQFHLTDAALPVKDPVALLYVARILARRIVEADKDLAKFKNELKLMQL